MIAGLLDEMAEQRLKEELLAYVLLLMHGEPFVDICPGSYVLGQRAAQAAGLGFVTLVQRALLDAGILLQTC